MITFKKYWLIKEKAARTKQLNNWDKLLKNNEMLRNGVSLMKELEALEPNGEILIVGGSVRDILLGKEPHDIDLAGNIPIRIISKHFKTADIGKSKDFGIVTILYNGFSYEYAMYRSDIFA